MSIKFNGNEYEVSNGYETVKFDNIAKIAKYFSPKDLNSIKLLPATK